MTLVKERGHGTLPKRDGTFVAWNNERWECFHNSNGCRSSSFAYSDNLRNAIRAARRDPVHGRMG